MPNLTKHLDSNEQMLLTFKPSRKAYLFQYVLFVIVLIVAFSMYGFALVQNSQWYSMPLQVLSGVIFGYAVIMFCRLEYRIWSRMYGITSERVLYTRGIFSETFKSIQYAYITNVDMKQTFWDKLMNTGTLLIITAGEEDSEIRYRKISNPLLIKKNINDLCIPKATVVQQNKTVNTQRNSEKD
jgi:uncharacterized membrane protein YdbT with pleckstrin-like domain